MQKEIDAALSAAKKHKARNDGEKSSVELIVALLTDASDRAGLLDLYTENYAKTQAVRDAEAALAAAQSA